jgi:hypothetical protein
MGSSFALLPSPFALKDMRRSIVILASLALGATLGVALLPILARKATPEAARLCTIVRACHSGARAEVAVLGNSVGMFGVDAGSLGRSAWNLCSPAQSASEWLLLEDELPPSVNTVVQIVTPFQLAEEGPMEREKWSALYVCGCRPGAAVRAAFTDAFGSASALDGNLLDARTLVRSRLERVLRDRIWPSDAEWRMAYDLRFPAPPDGADGGGWLARDAWAAAEGDRFRRQHLQATRSQLTLLRAELAGARRHGRRVLIVLAPLHPRIVALYGGAPMLAAFTGTVATAAPGVPVVDLTRLLTANEFRDVTHPTREGAGRLTARVAGAVRDLL